MTMHLQLVKGNKVHLSHFHHLVSAYETNEVTVSELENSLKIALEVAKNEKRTIVVDQDSIEHIFVVYPSGRIALYREVGFYEVVNEMG